jgi:hypothetical protein
MKEIAATRQMSVSALVTETKANQQQSTYAQQFASVR